MAGTGHQGSYRKGLIMTISKKDKIKKPLTHPEKRPKGINVKAVIAMAEGGMKQHEIAEEVGCVCQNVNAILLR